MGRAITPEIARQDVELMKGANLNAMRTTTYLQHPAAFEAADELVV
jgi:beta-galactosidase/beta-glucuronidase